MKFSPLLSFLFLAAIGLIGLIDLVFFAVLAALLPSGSFAPFLFEEKSFLKQVEFFYSAGYIIEKSFYL